MKICYLSAVLAIFSGVLPSHLVHFLRESIRMRKPAWGGMSRGGVGIAALALAFVVAAVDRFSVIHPFTLADNRHFTFYLNSRVFSRFNGKGKFVLVPLYFISLGSLASHFKTWIDGGGGGGGADARAKRAMRVVSIYFAGELEYCSMRVHFQFTNRSFESSSRADATSEAGVRARLRPLRLSAAVD